MPPSGARRPAARSAREFVTRWNHAWTRSRSPIPNPGWRPFQRLNRAEYAREVRDLLDLDVDVTAFLPADTISDGFDNVADVQTFSPTLDGRLSAGREPHRDAGDRRSGRLGVTGDVQIAEDRLADGATSTARRPARAAASRSTTPSLPTATMSSAWTSLPSRSGSCSATRGPARKSKSRSTAPASRSSRSIRG